MKRSVVVQLADLARLEPQVVDEMEKSPGFVPESAPAVSVTEFAVPLVMVAETEALLDPVLTLPKAMLLGDIVTVPEVLAPVPKSATVSAVVLALLVML